MTKLWTDRPGYGWQDGTQAQEEEMMDEWLPDLDDIRAIKIKALEADDRFTAVGDGFYFMQPGGDIFHFNQLRWHPDGHLQLVLE